MNLRPVILLLAWACADLSPLAAQAPADPTPPPDELAVLRRQAELRALMNSKTLGEQFSNALDVIAKEVGTTGDYDQALAAQRRRAQILALYAKSLGDSGQSNVIVLKPGDARVNGSVNYDRTTDALVTWRTVGSVAMWDVTKITPGSYEITLTYAVADMGDPGRVNPFQPPPDGTTGGEFEFYEDSSLAGAAQNRRSGVVAATGGWDVWSTLTLPPMQITRASARFALKITRARGAGGVMNLKEIRLSPPGTAAASSGTPPVPAGTAPPVDEFTQLQQAHLDRMKQAVMPVVMAYTGTLTALAEKATAAGDAEAAEDFTSEARRAASVVEDPQSILAGPAKGPKPGTNADGLRELRGATYVAGDKNTGDRFLVSLNGEQFFVRLLWVNCPPPTADDPRALKQCADYFGISQDDALAVGRQASAFTESFLAGKSLTLFTRGPKDAPDGVLAAIRPEGVGDFAGVLVDNGLAMIHSPAVKKSPARQHEDSILNGLKERETAAKSRTIPPGAWALGNGEDRATEP